MTELVQEEIDKYVRRRIELRELELARRKKPSLSPNKFCKVADPELEQLENRLAKQECTLQAITQRINDDYAHHQRLAAYTIRKQQKSRTKALQREQRFSQVTFQGLGSIVGCLGRDEFTALDLLWECSQEDQYGAL
eukprot:TRINITY_DN1973_c0_g1_i1.p1 TRINITY_DN1973_c0_g1~~TRINITY_DN1973_c0_g1_i1.p1  ORF type:complete len:137 (-),score=30.50 TRINITY_DN1973_c0_g1_i1:1-411(-)